jgi:hypothetical protein
MKEEDIPVNDMSPLNPSALYAPRYSGPNRSGICKCGHSWEDHHLGCVMNSEYGEATGEVYVPQECEKFGFNETGGQQFVDGKWVDHCNCYVDSIEEN